MKKFHFISSIWTNANILKEYVSTAVAIVLIIYVSKLLMLVDAEDVIIFNIFLILVVLFFILKGVVTKTIYNNKLYIITLFYVNYFLQEKIILTIYSQLLKNKVVLNSVKQVSSNWVLNSLEELNLINEYNSLYLEYLNSIYLNNLIDELNQEFIEKIEKQVEDIFILTQLNFYDGYLTEIGVLEDGTSKITVDSEDISDSESFNFEEVK